jgi:hypothetical protein
LVQPDIPAPSSGVDAGNNTCRQRCGAMREDHHEQHHR